MTEFPGHEPLSEIEALVRAAGSYVQPSEDLRPRVLETARWERHERWAQRRIWQVALVVALLGTLSTSAGNREKLSASRQGNLPTDSQAYLAEAAARRGDAGWNMVDSFTDLRRRQAELLRLAR